MRRGGNRAAEVGPVRNIFGDRWSGPDLVEFDDTDLEPVGRTGRANRRPGWDRYLALEPEDEDELETVVVPPSQQVTRPIPDRWSDDLGPAASLAAHRSPAPTPDRALEHRGPGPAIPSRRALRASREPQRSLIARLLDKVLMLFAVVTATCALLALLVVLGLAAAEGLG